MADRLLFLLARVQHRLMSHVNRELKKVGVGLSKGQMGVLVALTQRREATMGQLRETLDIDSAALTRVVDKLEDKGLVRRQSNPRDRRQVLISATEDGLGQAAAVLRVVKVANRRIQEGFSPQELDAFKRVNAAILEKFP
jgi:DNA-binding MarR family transcriptional regulator